MSGRGPSAFPDPRDGDLRNNDRAKRRLMVRFGDQQLSKTGFTGNISEGGLFIRTNSVFPPGATIQVEIDFPERSWRLWARVAWAKKVPPRLAHVLSCGMGVSFVDPPEDWYDFYLAWRSKSCHF